jgi:predicted RNase H-like nuclease (RuvC/YqgF family)
VEDSFKLLEDRVHRAVGRLKELAAEAQSLRAELTTARARADKAEQTLAQASGRPDAEEVKKAEALAREVRTLRRERDEIRSRIEKLVRILESLA